MVRDLTTDLKAVYACSSVEDKKAALVNMVEHSVATKQTKDKSFKLIEALSSAYKLDKFATNFVLSGEGMKVK